MSITKLTPQIVSMYLGQKAQWGAFGEQTVFTIEVVTNFGRVTDGDRYSFLISDIKPILRPLSSLTESEAQELFKIYYAEDWPVEDWHDEANGALRNWWNEEIERYSRNSIQLIGNPEIWLKLLSWGFDLFGLIEAGLAIAVEPVGDGNTGEIYPQPPIEPQQFKCYVGKIKYHRTDDLRPDALPDGSTVHLHAIWKSDEDEKFTGDMIFEVAEGKGGYWLPERDVQLLEETTHAEFVSHKPS